MTIYEIKRRTQKTNPYFFNRSTLKFFGQTMKSFKVHKINDQYYKITAPIYYPTGNYIGEAKHIFDSFTNTIYMKYYRSI
jgi:hypothetical protein